MKNLKFGVLSLSLFFLGLSFCPKAEAATQVYRSVGPAKTAALATGGNNAMSVSANSSVAVFTSALANNIGVGDVLQYDSNNNGSIGTGDTLAFISGRVDSTHFVVKNASGSSPVGRASSTTWSIFRAYTGLGKAESGIENTGINVNLRNFDDWTAGGDATADDIGKDLVSSGIQWNIACYGDAEDDTAGVVLQDWVTDATHVLKIYTPYLSIEVGESQRHNGVWSDSAYRLVIPDGQSPDGSAIGINVAGGNSINVWIDGLQVSTESSDMNLNGIEIFDVAGETIISNNIIKAVPSLVSNSGIYFYNYHKIGTLKAWNNIISGFSDGGISMDATGDTAYVSNNTVYGNHGYDVCYNAINGGYIAKNDIAQNCSVGFRGVSALASGYNLSDLADASVRTGDLSKNRVVLKFADLANKDFHLSFLDSDAIGAGTSLSAGQALNFSTDIDNEIRGAAWDIGADQCKSNEVDLPPAAPTGLSVN